MASRIRTASNALPAAVAFFTNHGFEHVLSNCEARAVLRECGIMEPSPAKLMVKKSLHTPMLDPSPLSYDELQLFGGCLAFGGVLTVSMVAVLYLLGAGA